MPGCVSKIHWRWILLSILVVALGLRLTAACGLQYLLDHRWHRDFLIPGDAEGYWLLAQTIASGEDYAVYTPPRYVLRMPGFPALLALPVSCFGANLFAARLMLAFVGTLACWLVFRLGKQVFDVRVGMLAAGLAAISPVFVGFSNLILSETTFAVALLWSLCAGHRLYELLRQENTRATRVFMQAVLTGLAIALGVMLRPSWILAAPIVAVLLVVTTSQRFKSIWVGGVIVVSLVVALLPWGIRNQQVTGHFTLTTFWMGPSLYDGLNPHATGDSDMRFYDRDHLMGRMDEYAVDQHYRRAAWDFAKTHPQRVVQLAWAKAVRYWSPWPNAEQFSQVWAKAIVSLFFVPSLLLAFWGGIRLFVRSRDGEQSNLSDRFQSAIWSMAILAGPILYFALLHMIFVSSLRYRLPAEYPLLVLTAFGAIQIIDSWRVNRS